MNPTQGIVLGQVGKCRITGQSPLPLITYVSFSFCLYLKVRYTSVAIDHLLCLRKNIQRSYHRGVEETYGNHVRAGKVTGAEIAAYPGPEVEEAMMFGIGVTEGRPLSGICPVGVRSGGRNRVDLPGHGAVSGTALKGSR
ncbi:hypothetical protein FQZ97_1164990 [compost metagenome]